MRTARVLFEAKHGPKVRVIDDGPAFQVHSALAQELKTGVGSAASSRYGLRPMAAGGKPGTSYNFSDALFAGYNSQVTCAVWMGFDKPTPIYRGAFGSQLALPVWVKVMNAAAQYYPTQDIKMPRTLTKVDICEKSGELATDRCFETVAGEKHRTTFTTYATAAEKPTQYCQVHGGGRSSIGALVVMRLGQSASSAAAAKPADVMLGKPVMKPVAAVDLSAVKPVPVKSQTVVEEGKDPYDLLQPAVATSATGELLAAGGTAAPGTRPRRMVRPSQPAPARRRSAARCPWLRRKFRMLPRSR